jgi:hypothetical protein
MHKRAEHFGVTRESDLVRERVAALRAEAAGRGVPADVLGRHLLAEVLALWLEERTWQDVASELRHSAENLDPDTDFEFMRP